MNPLANIEVLIDKIESQASITGVLIKELQSSVVEYQEFLEAQLSDADIELANIVKDTRTV